ncbi:MAG: hypothetical protein H7236_13930 [Gemmatimonadaceae bacterium]|nr:hypothetical protein [Caulobacter sp.]
MSERLDELVARLAASPMDRSLDGLDGEIGRSIADRRIHAGTSAALAPVRVASVGLALVLGVAVGGAVATSAIVAPHHYGTFAIAANLAPSTLLEGGE